MYTDRHSIGDETETAGNQARNVRKRQIKQKTQNSPDTNGTAMPKPPDQWKRVSADDIHVYALLNAPVVAPSRNFIFGQVKSGDEPIAVSVKGERGGGGDGR